jgi:hypothetical protein
MNKKSNSIIFLIFIQLISSFVFSQTVYSINLLKDSYLSIYGTTNIISFCLTQNIDNLTPDNFLISAYQNENKVFLNKNQISIPVQSFNSDNKMALRDFMKLMRVDSYPFMQVNLKYIEVKSTIKSKSELFGKAYIGITITGKTIQYTIPVNSIIAGENYIIKGRKKINIKDFGLNPPTVLLGLLKVNEWIDIDYMIKCKIIINNQYLAIDN